MKSSRTTKLLAGAAALLCLAACSQGAKIDGTVKDASDIIVKRLDVNTIKVLDTVKTKSGAFSYKVNVQKGDPEFIYLYHGDKQLASLILLPGDKVKVSTDTLGTTCEISGSEESVKLAAIEKNFNGFINNFVDAAQKAVSVADDADAIKDVQRELSRMYVNYYRESVKYVLENPFSLATIPLLMQQVNDNFPVFSQQTDAIHFRNVHDSLATIYPDSRFVKSLDKEAARRESIMKVNYSLNIADEVGFVDISLPNTKGEKVSLSSIDSKVIMVHFWAASEPSCAVFNQDILKPVYDEFHGKGLEVYMVSLDTDKAVWASAVKSQNLSWVNVCDGLGVNTPSVALYGVNAIPSSYFIVDGEIVEANVNDLASLRRFLSSKLR